MNDFINGEGDTIELVVGGIYSIRSSESEYGFARLLAVDEEAAHVRLYNERFADRPTDVEVKRLKIGAPDGAGTISVGHLPLRLGLFLSWEPELIAVRGVADEELEGYRLWRDAGGGLW